MHNFTDASRAARDAEMPQIAKITLYLADGTQMALDVGDFTMSYSSQMLSGNKFVPGAVCASTVSVTLFNLDHHLDGIEWQGAEFIPYVAFRPLPGDEIDWLQMTRYTVISPVANDGEVIQFTGYDNIYKTARSYDGGLTFPATLRQIAQYCADKCNVVLANPNFDFGGFTVTRAVTLTNVTYQQILSYIAAICCKYVAVNRQGQLEFRWLDNTATHNIKTAFSVTAQVSDVTITGCRVKAAGTTSDYGETWLIGQEGYVIELSNNPFVTENTAQTVAENLASVLNGLSFRPVSATIMPDLALEVGDKMTVNIGSKGHDKYVTCYLTNYSYNLNASPKIECKAEEAAKATLKTFSNNVATEIRNQAKFDEADQKLDNYMQNVEQMHQLAANTMGMYYTEEVQDDGSFIAYWHDNPTIAESTIVYKQGSDGFFLSQDGGNTWKYGRDSNGNVIVNVLSAIGINAEWIDIDGVIDRINADGTHSIDSGKVTIDGESLKSQFANLKETAMASIKSAKVEYAENTSLTTAPTTGWSTTQPARRNGYYIWRKTTYVYNDGSESTPEIICITGQDGKDGKDGEDGEPGKDGINGSNGLNGINLGAGKMLFTDPSFSGSTNGIGVYNNTASSAVTISRVDRFDDNPTASEYQLEIQAAGAASPGIGGFGWGNASRANAIFVYRIIAKIPVGRSIKFATNDIGDGNVQQWLTSTAGTGKFTEYYFRLICGAAGTFAETGYFYLDGDAASEAEPVTWQVAYATCFDMTAKDDQLTNAYDIGVMQKEITSVRQEAQEIVMQALAEYVTNSVMGEFKQYVESKLTQTAQDATYQFNQTQTQTIEVDGKLQEFIDTFSTYIRFSANGIDLGEANSPFSARLGTTKLSFTQSGREIAYISNNKLWITDAEITGTLTLGGLFKIFVDNNKVLCWQYVE